jgi:hypothetical protein
MSTGDGILTTNHGYHSHLSSVPQNFDYQPEASKRVPEDQRYFPSQNDGGILTTIPGYHSQLSSVPQNFDYQPEVSK